MLSTCQPYETDKTWGTVYFTVPQHSVEVALPDVDAGIKDLLSNPGCADFVTNLITTTAAANQNPAHSTNGLTVYGMIRGIAFERQVIGGREVAGTVGGSIGRHNATINISPISISSLAGANVHRDTHISYLMTALHETIHHGGTNGYYSDSQLAQAAYDLMSPERKAANPLPKRSDFSSALDFILASSNYWDDELERHCKPKRR